MIDYEAIYKVLFDGIADAIEDIKHQNYGYAKEVLIRTQQVAEEIFLISGDEATACFTKRS
jgi:hypothetical protein